MGEPGRAAARCSARLRLLVVSARLFADAVHVVSPPQALVGGDAGQDLLVQDVVNNLMGMGARDRELVGEPLSREKLEADVQQWLRKKPKVASTGPKTARNETRVTMLWLHGFNETTDVWEPPFFMFKQKTGMAKRLNISVPQAPFRRLPWWEDVPDMASWYMLPVDPPYSAYNSTDAFFDYVLNKTLEGSFPIAAEAYLEAALNGDTLILAGWSQGAYMAMALAYHLGRVFPQERERTPVGIFLSSANLFHAVEFASSAPEWMKQTPICWLHGEKDAVHLPDLQDVGAKALQDNGFRRVQTKRHDGGHEVGVAMLETLENFIKEGRCDTD